MKNIFIALLFPCFILQCTSAPAPNPTKRELYSLSHYQARVEELSEDQQSAFDALNTLQVSTDEKNQLYSTFANIEHTCYPPDSTFEISRFELLSVMQKYIAKKCTNLELSIQIQLTKSSVLAQDQYTVFHCRGEKPMIMQEGEFPMTGTWVFPSVLGRRDILLHW